MLAAASTSSWLDLVCRSRLSALRRGGWKRAPQPKEEGARVWSSFLKLVDMWPRPVTARALQRRRLIHIDKNKSSHCWLKRILTDAIFP